MSIKPTLAFGCTENWDKMKIGLMSRHCESCKRDVIDFTAMTRPEILQFLLENRNKKVCGRIFKSQLDYHHEEILITIQSYIKKNGNSNLSFYLLAVAAMMLLSCSPGENKLVSLPDDSPALVPSEKESIPRKKELNPQTPKCKDDGSFNDEFALLGDLTAGNDEDFHSITGARIFAEVMPEFTGGVDSLMAYFTHNLRYPEWEKKAGIQGNVFVSFTVDENGKVIDPRVIRSVSGSRNFDSEVIRLLKEMPAWKPGQQDGKNVAVQMVLPIKFKL